MRNASGSVKGILKAVGQCFAPVGQYQCVVGFEAAAFQP
jgi:hypothetical protein